MKRKIIEIDEKKCTGCGKCIPACPEGALQIIDGKARLISDLYCDAFGSCVGECPEGAISIVEREGESYDEKVVMLKNIIPKGVNTIKAHLRHLKAHNDDKLLEIALEALRARNIPVPDYEDEPVKPAFTCSGAMAQKINRESNKEAAVNGLLTSELKQWPVQLHLINPQATYFDNADLLISVDCVPYAFADFHQHYLKNRIVITFCPKLDNSMDIYLQKLTEIFKCKQIKSVTVVRMEVPCCGGAERLVRKALQSSGKELDIKIDVVSINGKITNKEQAP